MGLFLKRLLPVAFVLFAFFIAGVEFGAWKPVAEGYSPAWWKPLVSIAIGMGVFFSYFWPPRFEGD